MVQFLKYFHMQITYKRPKILKINIPLLSHNKIIIIVVIINRKKYICIGLKTYVHWVLSAESQLPHLSDILYFVDYRKRRVQTKGSFQLAMEIVCWLFSVYLQTALFEAQYL